MVVYNNNYYYCYYAILLLTIIIIHWFPSINFVLWHHSPEEFFTLILHNELSFFLFLS